MWLVNQLYLHKTAIRSDGRLAVSVGSFGRVEVNVPGNGPMVGWTTIAETGNLSVYDKQLTSVAMDRAGSLLATGNVDGSLLVFEGIVPELVRKKNPDKYPLTNPVQPLRTLGDFDEMLTTLAFSPDGQLVVVGTWTGRLELWHVASAARWARFEGHPNAVWAVAFSPDGSRLASVGEDGVIRVWDVPAATLVASGGERNDIKLLAPPVESTRAPSQVFEGASGAGLCLAFSPDGQTLASGGRDKAVAIRNLLTGERVHTLSDLSAPVYAVTFAPDGARLFAAVGADVLAWDASSAEPLKGFRPSGRIINALVVWPDGQRISVAGAMSPKAFELATSRETKVPMIDVFPELFR